MSKLEQMTRFLPGLYKPESNVMVRGLLNAWGGEDDIIVESVQNAKEQIYVKTARLNYLDVLGSNVGVFRPPSVNLSDANYRALIPILSFKPKQIRPTIQQILDIFFGVGNPLVFVAESTPNEIVVQIPSSVPALRRDLKGALHIHAYSGTITAINNILKTMTVALEQQSKVLLVSELKAGFIGQSLKSLPILDNTAGTLGVTLQFAAASDLSVFSPGRFRISLTNYPGSFLADKTRQFTVTRQRGVLGQAIVAGSIYPTLTMSDASGIPDAPGFLVFNYGLATQEAQIKYFARPNNTTLLVDPSYTFLFSHTIGEAVNMVVKPYVVPATNGSDYSVYLVGVEAARLLAQDIVRSVIAAGVVIRFIIVEPKC